MDEDTQGLGVIKDRMPPWGGVKKEMCYFQLVLTHPQTPWKIQMQF
jgi:hypothetical protein